MHITLRPRILGGYIHLDVFMGEGDEKGQSGQLVFMKGTGEFTAFCALLCAGSDIVEGVAIKTDLSLCPVPPNSIGSLAALERPPANRISNEGG